MGIEIKINRLGLTVLAMLSVLVLSVGCVGWYVHHPDPLAGWHTASKNPDQSIVNDYQNYIHTLSPEEQKFATVDYYFEDGAGQHAVEITIGLNHTNWRHILIYDKDNKRIKIIKYASGNSAS